MIRRRLTGDGGVRLFQIDNEPMNNGFTAERYAEVVNVYGARLREIAPEARIVACGKKRSNDMDWSEKVIDLAGKNFDILGVHNYEYEPAKLRERAPENPQLPREAAGLHSRLGAAADPACGAGVEPVADVRLAGRAARGGQSHVLYEELGPELTMTCPPCSCATRRMIRLGHR